MSSELCVKLDVFRKFAQSEASADQAVKIGDGLEIEKAAVTASALARAINRSEDAKNANENNNKVRDALVAALKDQFEVFSFDTLPDRVKEALKGTHAKTAEGDFKFVNGKSTSGRPLTQRRIAAVLKAVEQELVEVRKENATKLVVTEKVLAERMNADAVKEFTETVVHTLTSAGIYSGKPTPAVIAPNKADLARKEVSKFVNKHFCYLGDGKPEHTFQALMNTFRATWLGFIGVLPIIEGNFHKIQVWRDRCLRDAFMDAVKRYNVRHENSAYQVATCVSSVKERQLKNRKGLS